eukprot:CAMPEP_0177298354 /NCGR_PEP_ID=MMETSP0368-20130122/3460_1 /TAXON_ID=447022 ORGANISM="Scrippsiella hangoei-like, Strain SHHI-4" /NCGR_SAMPLE_ID=MMETSP0368 /ASSEMBLY_ACC=CAM_ASM_000363 /LENGTH=57 /DNA_ID=CAMNT_0018756639 /DNA_START=92 /DNA_END=262 /DNA_ORIENTATION=-
MVVLGAIGAGGTTSRAETSLLVLRLAPDDEISPAAAGATFTSVLPAKAKWSNKKLLA